MGESQPGSPADSLPLGQRAQGPGEGRACRNLALDRAIGQMANKVNTAADGINTLAMTAASESVRLAALRTIFTNMMAVSEFADLQVRMAQIEERLDERARAGNHGPGGLTPALASPGRALTDRSPWEWYLNSCPAGCRPESAARIPEPGRASGHPWATGGSGLMWPDAGRARRGPALLGPATGR